ncbi:hypothetical protein [Dactylosporangium sp. CA-139066]|uniref:hypothetical protein n=1 Tax=Dactylosporangium sp. CA-139066 TaxID=3239930 RepID=UPI003D8B6FB2
MTTSTLTRADRATHERVCTRPTTGTTWSDRCRCRHVRGRHTAATHAAIHTPNGTCTGRNLAGACLWPDCPCTGFTT